MNYQRDIVQMAEEIAAVRREVGSNYAGLARAMADQEQRMEMYRGHCGQLAKSLQEISQKYEDTEGRIAGSKV